MAVIPRLVVRDTSNTTTVTPLIMNLLIAIIVILAVGLILIGCFFVLRSHRKRKQLLKLSDLPFRANHPSSKISSHRRLTVTASPYGRHSDPIHVYGEKEFLIKDPASPSSPTFTIPEIRITFPEDEDVSGKRVSGRVVTVRISEKGNVGLEPYIDDHLPAYQKSDSERFQSLDLERMGGLKEQV